MRTIEIYVDGFQMDYAESRSIPLSIRKRTDKILEIVGADGSEIDNVLKSITFPDTLRNQSALASLSVQSNAIRGATRHQVKLVVNGIVLFAGAGVLKKATKRSGAAPSFYMELLGDGIGLWENLEKINLPDLNLGTVTWSFIEITANWNDHEFDDYPAYWCPVVYGNLKGDGYMWIKEFRPSVPFWRICKAIFEGQGYTIESDFYQTLFFRRHAYTFGVGDRWKIAGDAWENNRFKGGYNTLQKPWFVIGGGAAFVVFEADTDPNTMYFENGQPPLLVSPASFINPAYENYLEAQADGNFKLKISLNTVAACQCQVLVFRGVTAIFDKTYDITASDQGSAGKTVEVEFFMLTGDRIKFSVTSTVIGPGGEMAQIRSVNVSCAMLPTPFLGCDIDVASCLHDRPVKDFLRGISHMFCLAWRIDDVTKRVFFEPRFDYTLIEDGAPVTRRGFYRRDYPTQVGNIDASEVQVEYVSPFGDKLTMGYKEDSNDPLEKATLEDLNRDKALKRAPYYAYAQLHDRGVDGAASNNPYFTTLYQSKPGDIKTRSNAYLPTVLPSSYTRGNHLPGITWTGVDGTKTEEAPTFESEPKCGIMFPEALGFQFYYDEDAETLYYSETVNAPWITQQKWNDIGGGTGLADWDSHCAYASLKARDSDRVIRGLVATFYPAYISIVKEGHVLSGSVRMPLPDIANLTFRNLWRLPYDLNESIWILMELSGYKALVDDIASGQFLKYVPPTQADVDGTTHDDPNTDPVIPDLAKEV